ncbi:hypothetical protein [Vibrio campbellii]|uniref:hypothetical protein n=1 Tax=Vibrio campbellii TaxID=680 RepID=UPI0015E3988D|nr:hypothetical protein [Vibrio campbellii]
MKDELYKSRNHSLISSTIILLGLVSGAKFEHTVKIQALSIELTRPEYLWFFIVLFWLYFTHRFYVIAKKEYGGEIRKSFSQEVSSSNLVLDVFPPANYYSTNDVKWLTRAWIDQANVDLKDVGDKHCNYIRYRFGRAFEFQYLHPDDGYKHFLDKRDNSFGENILSGNVGIRDLGYLKCLLFELRFIIKQWGVEPMISTYYLPLWLAGFSCIGLVVQITSVLLKIYT